MYMYTCYNRAINKSKPHTDRPHGRKGNEMSDPRTITKKELESMNINSWSAKDNSPRGIHTAYTSEIKQGDKVVIDNYFTLVIA